MLSENEMKEGNTMEEKDEQEETKEEEIKSEENTEKESESEDKKEPENEKSKEPTLEDKYKELEGRNKELEEKYNALYKEKTDKDREIRHSESYKKYDLSQENINLLKRYLGDKEDIDEELSNLNKDFPHLFNKNKDTNISSSLDVTDKFKENKKQDVDTSKLGMVDG